MFENTKRSPLQIQGLYNMHSGAAWLYILVFFRMCVVQFSYGGLDSYF